MKNLNDIFATSESTRLIHSVGYLSKLEKRRIRVAKGKFLGASALVAAILAFDYVLGFAVFSYIAPAIGGNTLSAIVLALIFPIVMTALHLRIAEDDGEEVRKRLKRFSTIGIFAFLFGASALFASIMFDGAGGIGSSAIDGGSVSIGEGAAPAGENSVSAANAFGAQAAQASPVMFLFAMGFGLILTYYVNTRLLAGLKDNQEIFTNASDRWKEIGELVREFDSLRKEHERAASARKMLVRKLPHDPEAKFARLVSSAVHESLHSLKKTLHYFPEDDGPHDVLTGELARKSGLPHHIESRERGWQIIRDIKDAMRPYAIMGALEALPPRKSEDEN